MQWYLKVLKNYVGFQGRASRQEYWMFVLVHVIISLILSALSFVESLANLSAVLAGIYSLFVLLPSLAVGVRRLHDTGRSGWWVFISLIPLVGSIILLVFLCQDSQEADNQYGPNPKRSVSH